MVRFIADSHHARGHQEGPGQPTREEAERAMDAHLGIPVAVLVSTEDLRRLDRLDEQDKQAWDVFAAMRAPFRDVPLEEIERETERALAEVRAQMRAERERRTAE